MLWPTRRLARLPCRIGRSPANGYISTLILRQGDYAAAGKQVMAIIDSDSFHVRGYFEETKIPRIQPNDKVEIRLMGVSTPLEGHVESIDRAIADREIALNPTFQICLLYTSDAADEL